MDGKYIIILLFIFLVFLMGSINSTITNNFYNNTTGSQDHYNLTNLSFDDSGHTGFQSSDTLNEDIEALGYITNNTMANDSAKANISYGNYYVGKNGSDSNDCKTAWCLTIQKPLTLLSLSPVMTSDIIIIIDNGTYAENLVVPSLEYNGFTLTIQGTLTEVLNQSATGGADTVFGTSYGYAENTSASWSVDGYKDMLIMNYNSASGVNSPVYVPIQNNSATRVFYSMESSVMPVFDSSDRIVIKDWNTSISTTGNILSMGSNSKIVLKDIKVYSTSSRAISNVGYSFTEAKIINSYLKGSGATVYMQSNCAFYGLGSIIYGTNYGLRIENNCMIDMRYGNILRSFGGTPRLIFGGSAVFAYAGSGVIFDTVSKATNSKPIYMSTGSSSYVTNAFFENNDYSMYLDGGSVGQIVSTAVRYNNTNTNGIYDADFAGIGTRPLCAYANGTMVICP